MTFTFGMPLSHATETEEEVELDVLVLVFVLVVEVDDVHVVFSLIPSMHVVVVLEVEEVELDVLVLVLMLVVEVDDEVKWQAALARRRAMAKEWKAAAIARLS
eukprot:1870345-Amphidinium_carterae.1